MNVWKFLSELACFIYTFVLGENLEEKLISQLFKNYSQIARPITDTMSRVQLNLSFAMAYMENLVQIMINMLHYFCQQMLKLVQYLHIHYDSTN